MALDPVPWFVGGGAEHSPEIARLLAYAATGGSEGITAPADLLVQALPTPGTSVRVAPGSATILNRYAGASQQSYMARNATETQVAVTATTSSGGRSDMVILRIDDPQYGGTAPTDVKVGPYVRVAIVQNVGAGAVTLPAGNNYPYIILARIDIPVSTATITQAMIVDQRKMTRPRRSRDLYNTQPTSTTSTASTTSIDFAPQANRNIVVPSWASQVKIVGHVAGMVCRTNAAVGNLSAYFGATALQGIVVDMDVNTRATQMVSDTIAIPASLRGTTQLLRLRANRASGTGTLQTDTSTTVLWDVEFLEVASSD